MIFVIIVGLVVAVCIGYFIYSAKINKNAKNCSCGKQYRYLDGDIVDYYVKEKDKAQMPLGKIHALATVQLKCSQCGKTDEKKVRVIYDPSLKETEDDGIRHFFA